MRIRSGFKQRPQKRKAIVVLFRVLKKHYQKLMSLQLFQLPSRSKKDLRRGRKAKQFLQRDVLKKDFENPYRKTQKRTKSFLGWLAAKRFLLSQLALGFVILIWFVVLFGKETFYLNRIVLSGIETIPQTDLTALIASHLDERSLLLVKRSHRFFIATDDLERKIRALYGLESIEFTPHWPSNSFIVSLKEKEGVLAYSVSDQFYAIDKQGTVIRRYESLDEAETLNFPIIYQYQIDQEPQVGSSVLSAGSLEAILQLSSGLEHYPFVSIQSFRLKEIPKREVRIAEKRPESEVEEEEDDLTQDLNTLATDIAEAKTIDEKLESIKAALKQLEIEKLEEGSIEDILEKERVYSPDDEHQFQELEVVMNSGWTLKLGHRLLQQPQDVQDVLNIFATLVQQINIEGEVSEYIDLRFNHRVYYR